MAYGYRRSRRQAYKPRVVYVPSANRRRRSPAAGRSRRTYRRPRTTRSTRSYTSGAQTSMSGTGHGDKYILSQADPFDENVDGVKIPDANSQPSCTLKAEDTIDLTTGSIETAFFRAFNPSCANYSVRGNTLTNTTWAFPTAFANAVDSTKLAQLRSDGEMFRPVAHAVRITSGLAPTNAKGFVHVCVFTQALYNQATWAYPTSISQMQAVPGYKRMPIGRLTAEGLTVVNRPMDCTAQRYVDTDSPIYGNAGTMEFQSGLQWASILVAVTDVDVSSTPVSVEVIQHIEYIPRATAVAQGSPAATFNTSALAGASAAAAKTVAAALDSEKAARASTFVQSALGAIGRVGSGTIKSMPRLSALIPGFHAKYPSFRGNTSNVSMGDGIRNSVSSGMF